MTSLCDARDWTQSFRNQASPQATTKLSDQLRSISMAVCPTRNGQQKMLAQSAVNMELSWDSASCRGTHRTASKTGRHTQPWHSCLTQKHGTLSALEELKTELNSTSPSIYFTFWSTAASFRWALGRATIHRTASVLPATELHRNAMYDSDIYLFVIYFQTNGNCMNSFLGFQGHMPFMLDPERVMFRNVKLLIYLTASFNPPRAARTVSSTVLGA